MDESGYEIHSARAAARFNAFAVDKAVHHTGGKGCQQCAPSVIRMINEAAHINDIVLQEQQHNGKNNHVHRRERGEFPVNKQERENRERDVDNQRGITHAEMKHILRHSRQTVEPRRRESVVQNEYLVIESHQRGQRRDRSILPGRMPDFFRHLSILLASVHQVAGL